ncbi:MAG: DUF58 domain-containing protein [Calditrichaeota bacterium]|nr:DUF58 domain-containing protein [Calditrichota bacterium]RQV99580.1 MAG: DUF58 domain-containing protein [Calditrichota bacterium]
MPETNSNIQQYLQPDFVSGLRNLDFVARMIVEGFLVGLHKSPYHGFSVEFSEHRQYMPGDNIRNIDWKVYGRTGRYYIKQYEEETNLKAYILLDISGSMKYHSEKISKIQYATFLSAALAYLLIQQRDAAGLVTFSDKIHRFLPPKSSRSYLHFILKELSGIELTGSRTVISSMLHAMAEKIKRRGLIILLTDFLYEDPEQILHGLKHFRHYKHEILVFNILDPNDRYFNFRDEATFQDMETGEKIKAQPYFLQERYRETVGEFYQRLQQECMNYQIDFQNILTSEPFDRALLRYLLKRKKLY